MTRRDNIALAGFMGTGKSAVGRALARRLGRPFLDMDDVIEQRCGCSIGTIFARDGEPTFRAMEKALVRELSERKELVIACGGGVALDPENIRMLETSGLLVCLQSSPETILKRVGLDTHRPLLEGADDKLGKIRELLAARRDTYAVIRRQVSRDHQDIEKTVDEILDLYRQTETEGDVS